MRHFRYWALLLLLISCASFAARQQTLLVLGDSLSAAYRMPVEDGWVNLLAKNMEKSHSCVKVVNASISGDTTRQGLSRLPTLMQEYKPSILIIELGANDGLRKISPQATERNIKSMIDIAQKNNTKVLLFEMTLPPNYGSDYIQQFEKIYSNLGKERNVTIVPFFLKNVATKPKYMQFDRMHPNAKAQPIILDNVWPSIKKALPYCW